MKIKLMIALAILALVFGMSFTACDDGDLPKITQGTNETILDIQYLGSINTSDKHKDELIPKDNTLGYTKWVKKVITLNALGDKEEEVTDVADPTTIPPKPWPLGTTYYEVFVKNKAPSFE
jgi:hypothetical protein